MESPVFVQQAPPRRQSMPNRRLATACTAEFSLTADALMAERWNKKRSLLVPASITPVCIFSLLRAIQALGKAVKDDNRNEQCGFNT